MGWREWVRGEKPSTTPDPFWDAPHQIGHMVATYRECRGHAVNISNDHRSTSTEMGLALTVVHLLDELAKEVSRAE